MLKAIFIGLLLTVGCSHKAARQIYADAGAKPVPLDRLLPSELGQSSSLVFGFPIPPGMRVARRYPESVYLQGSTPAIALKEYLEAHLVVGPSELDGHRRTYRSARIRGGDPNRIYQFELDELRGERQIIVTDITPKPPQPGLSDEERWKRAGFLPDGTPIASAQSM